MLSVDQASDFSTIFLVRDDGSTEATKHRTVKLMKLFYACGWGEKRFMLFQRNNMLIFILFSYLLL